MYMHKMLNDAESPTFNPIFMTNINVVWVTTKIIISPGRVPHRHLSCKIVVWAMRCYDHQEHISDENFFAIWEWEIYNLPDMTRGSERQTLHRIISRRTAVIPIFGG